MCAAADVICVKVVMTLAVGGRDRERLSLFVDEMRAMRAERGWSRAELAAQAQYSESLIAMVEDASGGRVAEEGPALSETALCFEALRSEALPKPASRDLIAKVAKERWTA